MQLSAEVYQAHTSPMQSHINVGYGSDVTIAELAQAVATAVASPERFTMTPANRMVRHASGWTAAC